MGLCQGIAICLGSFEARKIEELSSQFFHVIVVNAAASVERFAFPNVTVCPFAPFSKRASLFLGPTGLKEKREKESDISVPALTWKQILYDFVYADKDLSEKPISKIVCDLNGFEEHILEDLFYFAYSNECPLFLSLYPEIWQSHTLSELAPIFSHFTGQPEKEGSKTICFTPKKTEKFFLKKNTPAVILCYNQPTFLRKMVSQLEKYTQDILVIDNHSTYKPLLDYYENEFCYTLLRQKENFGHLIYRAPFVKKLTGEVYLLTDPDLELNPNLPDNFIETFFAISLHFQAIRVGAALNIQANDLREGIFFQGHSIQEWEKNFWQYRLHYPDNPNLELYDSLIDTTFCLVNKRFCNKHIRVAKEYTCTHIPWHKHFEKKLLPGEYEAYLTNNKSTTYWK